MRASAWTATVRLSNAAIAEAAARIPVSGAIRRYLTPSSNLPRKWHPKCAHFAREMLCFGAQSGAKAQQSQAF